MTCKDKKSTKKKRKTTTTTTTRKKSNAAPRFRARSRTLSAKEVSGSSACGRTFAVDVNFFRRAREFVRTGTGEVGGDAIVDFESGLIAGNTTQRGGFDRVDLQRGLVDWHTHPATCRHDRGGRKECTIGAPSPSDFANIVTGASRGTLAHLLFSREGTYMVRVADDERARLIARPGDVAAAVRRARDRTKALFDAFDAQTNAYEAKHGKEMTGEVAQRAYDRFRQSLFRLARELKFVVEFFPGAERPRFALRYHCDAAVGMGGLNGARARTTTTS